MKKNNVPENDLFINEFLAINDDVIADEFDEWVYFEYPIPGQENQI